ncbi:MAG: succinate dehydrogenase, hydrophobic membrane anchor protein [Candidatus Fonsibacter lacus]|uniref:Succinate dehydrogenase hydrophobic membrane anchor subunit n=1 Tax=Candidatus Fonsibacter lacus TaxID=2576439 RepID=A0A966LZJ1_9PROT|nr:succinate dehydrogenase, hydrophobic membrane anchor protein [Candidatus Fonsibacter lacus]
MKNHALNKWIIQRVSAIALIPLLLFFLYSLVDLINQDYTGALDFFDNYLSIIVFTLFLIFAGLHLKLGLGEIVEDYIQDERLKGILNKLIMLYSAILPVVGIVSLIIIIL